MTTESLVTELTDEYQELRQTLDQLHFDSEFQMDNAGDNNKTIKPESKPIPVPPSV
jgi:hypothetical protein